MINTGSIEKILSEMNVPNYVILIVIAIPLLVALYKIFLNIMEKNTEISIKKSSHKISLIDKGIIDNDDINGFIKEEITNKELSSLTKLYDYKYNILFAYIMHKSKSRINKHILRKFINFIIEEDGKLTIQYKLNYLCHYASWFSILIACVFTVILLFLTVYELNLLLILIVKNIPPTFQDVVPTVIAAGLASMYFWLSTVQRQNTPKKAEIHKLKKQLSEIEMNSFHKLNIKLPLS